MKKKPKIQKLAKNDTGSISQLNFMKWLTTELEEDESRLKDNILGLRGQMWYHELVL